MNDSAASSGMGACGFVGQIGVYTGWLNDIAAGTTVTITGMDWLDSRRCLKLELKTTIEMTGSGQRPLLFYP